MPRRNNRIRRQVKPDCTPEIEPSYEDMARALVKAGKASRLILGPLSPGREIRLPRLDNSDA